MAELINHTYSGMTCDAHGCTAELRGEPIAGFEGARHYYKLAATYGWSIWVSRSRRTYCPQHGPKPGHKMFRLAVSRG